MAAGVGKDIQTHIYILMMMINLGSLEDLLIFIFLNLNSFKESMYKDILSLFCFQTPKAGDKKGPRELRAKFSNSHKTSHPKLMTDNIAE